MKTLIKKTNAGAIILLVSIIIAIVAFCVTIYSNSFAGYQMTNFGGVIAWGIIAILTGIAFLVLCYIFPNKHVWIGLIGVVFVFFLGMAARTLLLAKQPVFGSVIFSALERGVPNAEGAAYTGMAALIIYIVASVVAVVATFFQIFKDPKGKETIDADVAIATNKVEVEVNVTANATATISSSQTQKINEVKANATATTVKSKK